MAKSGNFSFSIRIHTIWTGLVWFVRLCWFMPIRVEVRTKVMVMPTPKSAWQGVGRLVDGGNGREGEITLEIGPAQGEKNDWKDCSEGYQE